VEETAINRGIANDPDTLEMTSEVFKRVKPEPDAPVQRERTG